jgi:hypothetical protein
MILLLASLGHAAECPEPLSPSALVAQVDDAMLAWASMDPEGFSDQVGTIQASLPCLDAPLDPAQAASLHRVMALQAFLDGDAEAARRRFEAASVAQPDYQLSERVAPEGGKLQTLFQDARLDRGPVVYRFDVPDGLRAWVDGVESDRKPESLPVVLQVGDRAPRWSTYLLPKQDPAYPADLLDMDEAPTPPDEPVGPVAPEPEPAMADLDAPRAGGGPSPLWFAAAGSGVAAGGLFATSAALRSSFDNDPSRGTYNAVNGTFLASAGLTAVTGGLVVAALASGGR